MLSSVGGATGPVRDRRGFVSRDGSGVVHQDRRRRRQQHGVGGGDETLGEPVVRGGATGGGMLG